MFGLMYLNTYALDHVGFSQTRTWMAVVMGAAMAVIMAWLHAGYVPQQAGQHRDLCWRHSRLRWRALAGSQLANG
jgi:hypothetical protein